MAPHAARSNETSPEFFTNFIPATLPRLKYGKRDSNLATHHSRRTRDRRTEVVPVLLDGFQGRLQIGAEIYARGIAYYLHTRKRGDRELLGLVFIGSRCRSLLLPPSSRVVLCEYKNAVDHRPQSPDTTNKAFASDVFQSRSNSTPTTDSGCGNSRAYYRHLQDNAHRR